MQEINGKPALTVTTRGREKRITAVSVVRTSDEEPGLCDDEDRGGKGRGRRDKNPAQPLIPVAGINLNSGKRTAFN